MSRQQDRIDHRGRIVEIGKDTITVEIINKSACAECHAKGVCAASDQQTRQIEVPQNAYTLTAGFEVGDEVNVVLSAALGMKAIMIAYAVPLALMVAMILILSSLGVSELNTGLFSICTVAIYYIFVMLFRNRLQKVFVFSIEQI